jgi:hypothetical protein
MGTSPMAISSDQQRPASYDEGPTTAMTPDQRAQFEKDGYLIIRGALTPTEVEYYTAALDRGGQTGRVHAPA